MSFDLVLFGGTGDLTWRKLMPALFQAWRHGKLPAGGRILAVARDERSDAEYRQFIRERFPEVDSAKRPSDDEFARFAELLHYRRMDLSQPAHYAGLKQWIDARGPAPGAGNPAARQWRRCPDLRGRWRRSPVRRPPAAAAAAGPAWPARRSW